MKTIKVSSILLLLASMTLNGQNLIGSGEQAIRQYMAENQKTMKFQNFVNNSTFKYLKYSDNDETITLLYFLNEQLVCKAVRLVCDKSLKDAKIKEYNSLYKKAGDNQWTEIKDEKSYNIVLKEEEWSFNVTITLIE